MIEADSAKSPPTAAIAWALIVLGIALLVFIVGSSTGIYLGPVRILAVVAATVGLGSWLMACLRWPALRPASRLYLPLGAVLLALAVSAILAPIPRLALDYLGYAALLAGLYLLLVRIWRTPSLADRLGMLALILAAGMAVLYLVAVVRRWIDLWVELGHITAPTLRPGYEGLWFGNPNAFAPVVVLLLLTAVAHGGFATARRRWTTGIVAVLVAVDVLLTGSRGAWVGLAAAMAVVGLVAVARRDGRALLRQVTSSVVGSRAGRGAVVLGLLAIVVAAVLVAPAVLARVGDQAAETRTPFWGASLRMLFAHPVTGVGPGAWAPARPAYTQAGELDTYIPHAHNLPLHVVSELGLIGVLATIIVVVVVGGLVLRGLGDERPGTGRTAWVALFAIAFVLGQHLVDEYVHQPAVLFAIALPIAKLDSLDPGSSQLGPSSRRLVTALLVAVLVGGAAALWVEGPALRHSEAVSAANAGEWERAVELEAGVVADDPWLAPYRLTLGVALANVGRLDEARGQLEVATRLDDFAPSWVLLGAIQSSLGDATAAAASLERAMRLGRQQPAVAVAASEVYGGLRLEAEAIRALADAVALAPTLVADPVWASGERATRMAAAVALVRETASPVILAQVGLEGRDLGAARAAAGRVIGPLGAALELAADGLEGKPGALEALQHLAAAHPTDQEIVAVCLRAMQRAGAVDEHGFVHCPETTTPGTFVVVTVDRPTYRQTLPGSDAPYHAIYGYRRDLPGDIGAPWLPNLVAVRP